MTGQEDYLSSLDADELQAEQEFLDNHWVNDMLDAPHALIAVIKLKSLGHCLENEDELSKF